MTTTVTVKANHGCPVNVKGIDPKTGKETAAIGWNVPAGEQRDFHCHSGMNLLISEIQPDATLAEKTGA